MRRVTLATVCAATLLAGAGCTGDKKTPAATASAPGVSESTSAGTSPAPPSASEVTTGEVSSAAASSSPAGSSAVASGSSTSIVESVSISPSPTEEPPSSPPANPTSAPADAGQLAAARKLLVTGTELGGDWLSLDIPAGEDREQGDVCGTATAAEIGRVLAVSVELTNPNYEGAGQHTIARYPRGGAAAVARTMLDLLGKCKKLKHDFDGESAIVDVTPQTANMATFTLTFESGSVNHGGIAITNTAEYVSISQSYAGDAPTAAELAGELDLRAQRKLKDAGLK